MQTSQLRKDYIRQFWVEDKFIEPYHPHQNPAERAMALHKSKIQKVMINSGCQPEAWFRAACHVADVDSVTAKEQLDYRTPLEYRDGETPDITTLLKFEFNEPVLYHQPGTDFPSEGGSEKLGYWMG